MEQVERSAEDTRPPHRDATLTFHVYEQVEK